MKVSTKILTAGVALAAATALAAHAFADRGHGGGPGRTGMGGMHGMGPGGMRGEHADPAARLATLKAELSITAAQAADWDAYAKVVTDVASARKAHRDGMDRETMRNLPQAERQAHFDSMQKQRDADRAKVKSAADALLAKLDDAQKAKAQQSLPGLADGGRGQVRRHGMGPGMGQGEGQGMGPGGMGHGMGPGGPGAGPGATTPQAK